MDLSKVALPDFEVTIEKDTLVRIYITVVLIALTILLMWKATKKI